MTTKFNKLPILLLLLASLGLAVSACVKKPVAQPASQNANASATTSEIDASDRKTYRYEEYGFEFKYPEAWTFKEGEKDEDPVGFYPPGKKSGYEYVGDIVMSIYDNQENTSLAEFLKTKSFFTQQPVKREINGMDVYFLESASGNIPFDGYVLAGDGYVLELMVFNSQNDVAEDMIKMLTFFDIHDPANWKTYTNDGLHYQFKYPGYFEITSDTFTEIKFKNKRDEKEGLIVTLDAIHHEDEASFVRYITGMRNKDAYDYYFSNDPIDGKTYESVHWLWNFKDRLGRNTYSELLVYNNALDYGLSFLIYTAQPDTTKINDTLFKIQENAVFLINSGNVPTPDVKVDNWKLYQSDDLNFAFKYPEHWKLEERPEMLVLKVNICDILSSKCITGSISLQEQVNNRYMSASDIPEQFTVVIGKDDPLVVLGQEDFMKYGLKRQVPFYIKTDVNTYKVTWNRDLMYISDPESDAYKALYTVLLDEFNNFKAFVGTIAYHQQSVYDVDTSHWPTYKNQQYGFEFRHPAGWEVNDAGQEIGKGSHFIVSVSPTEISNLGMIIYERPEPASGSCYYQFKGTRSCNTTSDFSRDIKFKLGEKNINVIFNYSFKYSEPWQGQGNLTRTERKLDYIMREIEKSLKFDGLKSGKEYENYYY